MFRRKSIFVIMSIFMIVVLALAGCSSSTNESASSDGKTVIKFMHLWPEGSSKAQYTIVNSIIKQYEKDHSDIKIQTEILGNEQYKDKIKVLSASNELPDVGVTWAAGYLKPFVEGNMLAPLDEKRF